MPIRFAILGVGIAGRARARAIQSDPRCALVAVHRGRFAAELGVPQVGLDEAIATADVVAVCSPTPLHPEHVRRALEADRHVVVEFPVAPSRAVAADLFALARARGRILHVEHIERLDGPSTHLAAHVHDVREVHVSFTRRGPADAPGNSLALGNVARLHRVHVAAGPFARVARVTHGPGRLDAELVLASGAPVHASFRQGPDLARHTAIDIHDASGTWRQRDRALTLNGAPVDTPSAPLFAADHDRLVDRLLGGAPPYVADDAVLHVLSVVDALASGRTGPVPR